MKKTITAIAFVVLMIFGSAPQLHAQDGIFSDAQTLGHKQFSLGVQPIFYTQFDNDNVMLMLRAAYGLQSNLSFHGKLGVLRNETYFGGHFEYMLASEPYNPISFSFIGGAYSFGDIGLKVGGVISKRISQFSLYSGLTFEPLFADSNTLKPFLLPIGVDIPIAGKAANFVFEANLGLNDDANAYESLHFGMNFYF